MKTLIQTEAVVSSFYGPKRSGGVSKPNLNPKKPTSWTTLIDHVRSKSEKENCFVVWREFHRQESAFKAVDTSSESLRVFSFETDALNPGKRKFLVTTYRGFWSKYCKLPPQERVFYELIRENTPCKLYFDLEYSVALNPNTDSERIMSVFKNLVFNELHCLFKISQKDCCLIDLSSTTESKFSRHLIFNLSKADTGRFVTALLLKINNERRNLEQIESKTLEQQQRLSDLSCLYVHTEKGLATFIDEGVYSKNRNFRCFQSTKIGKSAFLTQASGQNNELNPNRPDYFISTLVGSVRWTPGTRILEMTAAGIPSLVAGAQTPRTQLRLLPKPDSFTTVQQTETSQFPLIDSYICQWIYQNASDGGVGPSFPTKPTIKSVSCFSNDKILLYAISGNKFCFNVQRHHKSNGVYYTVDLKRGVFNQRCHDYDCRHFMSQDHSVPVNLNPYAFEPESNAADNPGGGEEEEKDSEPEEAIDADEELHWWNGITDQELLEVEGVLTK
ncbi:hypothetical protein BDR26DRAFT_877964 [Obelidium mucronatum]|nr:hypothetical protein BDR26DRAFT_877964 [Obelidium mucronatum]